MIEQNEEDSIITIQYQARSQGFELGGSDFGHTQNHTQCHTPFIVFLTYFR